MHQKRHQEAIPPLQEFLEYEPTNAEARFNLGVALAHIGDKEEAQSHLERGLALRPNSADILAVLGGLHSTAGRMEMALECLNRALELARDKPSARWNRAAVNLTLGNWLQGWEDYEFGYVSGRRNNRTILPKWDGSALNGRKLLIYSEQGYGDTIWATKMAHHLAGQHDFTLEVQTPLVELMHSSGFKKVVAQPSDNSLSGHFDVAISLMSLPWVMKLASDEALSNHAWLKADDCLVSAYSSAMPDRKIGLVWQGRKEHDNDHVRSIQPEDLKPLAGIPFLGLQEGNENYKNLPEGMDIMEFGDALVDFSVTAGVIANLDLVVTVDTAVAHLAGALGKPCYLMLPKVIDFRWQSYTEKCPWYPSIKIFRQEVQGEWGPVLDRVAKELN